MTTTAGSPPTAERQGGAAAERGAPPHFPLHVPRASTSLPDATVRSPFDGTPVATFAPADSAAIEAALANAAAAFAERDRWIPVPERIRVLGEVARHIEREADDLALTIAREGGKPLADARVEVLRAADSVRGCIDVLRTGHGAEIPMGINAASSHHFAVTTREPVGPVVAISAFNHPLNLIVHQVATAVAAGCPVIAKPAEATPVSCFRFADMLVEAGLPAEWCQVVVPTDVALAERLATDARVAFLTFIGSARVGWLLRSRLAPGTRCALEHGGAAPVLVAGDADVERLLPVLTRGAFYHAGQVCVSIQRIFADRSVARPLAVQLAERARALRVGDPTDPATEVGPLIRPAEVDRVERWVREAVDGGGELLAGGERLSGTTFAPTVLYDPPAAARVSTEEVFGPVVSVYPCDSLDEMIARANALPYAFQSAVCTRSIDVALRAWRRLAASAVMVNESTTFRVDWMPFAGLRLSGLGVGGIPYTMRDMQVEKMLVLRSEEL